MYMGQRACLRWSRAVCGPHRGCCCIVDRPFSLHIAMSCVTEKFVKWVLLFMMSSIGLRLGHLCVWGWCRRAPIVSASLHCRNVFPTSTAHSFTNQRRMRFPPRCPAQCSTRSPLLHCGGTSAHYLVSTAQPWSYNSMDNFASLTGQMILHQHRPQTSMHVSQLLFMGSMLYNAIYVQPCCRISSMHLRVLTSPDKKGLCSKDRHHSVLCTEPPIPLIAQQSLHGRRIWGFADPYPGVGVPRHSPCSTVLCLQSRTPACNGRHHMPPPSACAHPKLCVHSASVAMSAFFSFLHILWHVMCVGTPPRRG